MIIQQKISSVLHKIMLGVTIKLSSPVILMEDGNILIGCHRNQNSDHDHDFMKKCSKVSFNLHKYQITFLISIHNPQSA